VPEPPDRPVATPAVDVDVPATPGAPPVETLPPPGGVSLAVLQAMMVARPQATNIAGESSLATESARLPLAIFML